MNLNNKGITLVEIIISVVLIAIVLIFLFSLLIQVNNENLDNEIKTSYLITQSTFISQIQEDFLNNKLDYGLPCTIFPESIAINIYNKTGETDISNIYIPRWNNDLDKFKCLSFRFEDESLFAHLFLYQRTDNKTILSYYKNDYKQSVELNEFDWTINSDTEETLNTGGTATENTWSLPIIGPDYNDYSINLSYDTSLNN